MLASGKPRRSFLAFYLRWADMQGWDVPALHVELCVWLEAHRTAPLALVMIFRGAAKSTIVGCFKAWQLWEDAAGVHQVWGADKKVAGKMSRYTKHVLRRHPWTGGMLDPRAPDNGFFVAGSRDMRNPSMEAIGIDSSATGSRSTATCFDDVEVPKNIRTAAKRESLREKIDEAMHILVPGGSRLYVGTPHTHQTIYADIEEEGAVVFKRPLFADHLRCSESSGKTRFEYPFRPGADGLYVFMGIHKFAKLLKEGRDYLQGDGFIQFAEPPKAEIDIYANCAWPDRFDRRDVLTRRKACRTINSWDSQYMLQAKPISNTRLDPDRMIAYEAEPRIEYRNRVPVMMLGKVQIAGFVAYWDVSLGKLKSDASALCVVLTDFAGRLYWHRAVELTGDLEELDSRDRLIGGQVAQLIETLREIHCHQVHVETNGPGGFVPPILIKHAKPHGIGVTERFQTGNKQERILDAFEAPLSSRILWVHTSVAESPAYEQLRGFDPLVKNQTDDYIDAAAGAIHETPVRVERLLPGNVEEMTRVTRQNEDAEVAFDWE